jgi:hypothetical protein
MDVQQEARPRDAAGRAETRRQWLDRIEHELATAGASAASQNPDALCRHLDAMVAAARAADVLSPADKQDIGVRADALKFELHRRHLDAAAAHPREHRSFTRWRAPPLTIAIGGRTYASVDWSLGGVLLADVEDRGWKCGQAIDVEIGFAGRRYADRMIVVRHVPEAQRLALRTGRFATALTQVKSDCEAAGAAPA